MSVVWNLYRFDYARYLHVRPFLRSAADPAAFAALADGPETDALVEALLEGELDVVTARQAFLIAVCCVGEPLPCPERLPRTLQKLRQDVRSEAGTELLTDALAGGRNLESWLLPKGELVGFLTPEESVAVLDAYQSAETRRRSRRTKSARPIRHGGLLYLVGTFLRRLFDRGLGSDEVYRLLGELLEEAVTNRQGIAVVSV